jgi:tetratricopeptide (TPR) repeat protein
MNHTKAFRKYVEQLRTGCFTHFSENDYVEIVAIYLDDYNTAQAQSVLNRALKQYPGSVMLRRLQVTAMIDRGELKGAELLLDEYFRDDKSMTTEENRFLLAMKQCRYADACEIYIQTLADGRTNAQHACARLDEVSEAIPHDIYVKAMQRMGALFPDNLCLQQEVGANLLRVEATKEALPFLNPALDLDSYDAVTWENLSRCQYDLKLDEECIKSCNLGLSIDEDNAFMRYFRGGLLYDRKQFADAITDLKIAYDTFTGKVKDKRDRRPFDETEKLEVLDDTLNMLAWAHEQLGQMQECVFYWREMCELHPKDPQKYHDLTLRLMDLGDVPEALRANSYSIQYAPNNERYLMLRVSLLISCKRSPKEIGKAVVDVIKVNPDSTQAWATLAELSRLSGDAEKTYQCYCVLRDLRPKEGSIVRSMAAYFESIGEPLDMSQFPIDPEA